MTRPVLVLVGPPGAGKSTVGALVAEGLGVGLRDTDTDVEAMAGMTVSDVFFDLGEERFRELEREAVSAALAEHDGVLALGGGAILDQATRTRLKGHFVVLLDVAIAAAAPRIGLNRARPLLVGNPRAQWVTLMAARRPFYDEVASATVSTDLLDAQQVADTVVTLLGERR